MDSVRGQSNKQIACLFFFPFPFFLKFGITAVLKPSSPCRDGVIHSLKTFTAAESKIFKIQYRALFQKGNAKKEGGGNETPPCKMLSSCNGDKSVLCMQK